MTVTTLETSRLFMRRPNKSDLEPYSLYCQSPRTAFVGGPFRHTKAFEKLASMIGHWELRGFGRFVCVRKDDGRPIGHVGALLLDPVHPPEMTWTIWHERDERQGFAREAASAYLAYAKTELGFEHMVAHVARENDASRQLAVRLGGVLNPEAAAPNWFPNAVVYDLADDQSGQGPVR